MSNLYLVNCGVRFRRINRPEVAKNVMTARLSIPILANNEEEALLVVPSQIEQPLAQNVDGSNKEYYDRSAAEGYCLTLRKGLPGAKVTLIKENATDADMDEYIPSRGGKKYENYTETTTDECIEVTEGNQEVFKVFRWLNRFGRLSKKEIIYAHWNFYPATLWNTQVQEDHRHFDWNGPVLNYDAADDDTKHLVGLIRIEAEKSTQAGPV